MGVRFLIPLLLVGCGQLGFELLESGDDGGLRDVAGDGTVPTDAVDVSGDGTVPTDAVDVSRLDDAGPIEDTGPVTDVGTADGAVDASTDVGPMDSGAEDAGASCTFPVLLESYSGTGTGMHGGGVATTAALTLDEVGRGTFYPSGFTGTTDFLAGSAEVDEFASHATDGVAENVVAGIFLDTGSGGGSGSGSDASLIGKSVAFVRQIVNSVTLSPARMRTATSYDYNVTWEVWGCD